MCLSVNKYRSYLEEIWYSFASFLVQSTEKFNLVIAATKTTSMLVSWV